MSTEKLRKLLRRDVRYRPGVPILSCKHCCHREGTNCELVRGTIKLSDVCDEFIRKPVDID